MNCTEFNLTNSISITSKAPRNSPGHSSLYVTTEEKLFTSERNPVPTLQLQRQHVQLSMTEEMSINIKEFPNCMLFISLSTIQKCLRTRSRPLCRYC